MIPEMPIPEEVELLHSKPIFDDSRRRHLLPPLLQSAQRLCFSAENLLGLHQQDSSSAETQLETLKVEPRSKSAWTSTTSLQGGSNSSTPSLHKSASQNIKQFSDRLRENIVNRLITPVIQIHSI